jgi:hypothetical protein
MKRIKQLIKDHKFCWPCRKDDYIKWRIEYEHKDIPACSFFILPTIVYNTYPYRRPGTFVFNVYFLHWYIGIGEWGYKEK